MKVSRGERRALSAAASDLCRDRTFAAYFRIFNRLAEGEALPGHERLSARWWASSAVLRFLASLTRRKARHPAAVSRSGGNASPGRPRSHR
jgi:hypothetical protein